MRFFTKVTIPSEKWDEAQRSGTLTHTMDSAIRRINPEAAYIFEEDGQRECLFVYHLDVPSLLKPLFPNLGASFEGRAVMNVAEFGFGGAEVKQRTEKPDILADIRPVAPVSEPQYIHPTPPEPEQSSSEPDEPIKKARKPEPSEVKPR
ncbi:MAG: hypothetical protein ACR2M2_09320 [Gaiellaceae bacterium]